MRYRRVFLIILDGLGVGGAPDAAAYGDADSDTLMHIAEAAALELPSLARLGLGNLYPEGLPGLPRVKRAEAHHARLTEVSAGKDTTTGHWELMGIVREEHAPTFPEGFPAELLEEFSRLTGRGVLGNRPASGTVIIKELGEEHINSGKWIVYTSADSVFQLAAHTDVVPLDELYAACERARELLVGELGVDRVIARPFTGDAASGFTRTVDRRDYSIPPPGPTMLDKLSGRGLEVIGVGKISDIFAGQGLTQSYPEHGNDHLMERVERLQADQSWRGLAFCNLVDFDMLYGHRNNPAGYAAALNEFDLWLGEFLEVMLDDELLILTADHGNDPTTDSTDHSREQVPLLVTSPVIAKRGGVLTTPPPGFHHVGSTCTSSLLP